MTKPDLIDRLVADNRPVHAMRATHGRLFLCLSAIITFMALLVLAGPRPDLVTFTVPPETVLHWGIWLIVAMACGFTAADSALPEVGSDRFSWRWTIILAMLLPVLGTAELMRSPALLSDHLWRQEMVQCLTYGLAAGGLTLVVLVLWLRRGAPVVPKRSGLLAGLSAGAVGTFAYSLHCPIFEPAHTGLIHALPVIASALFGRLVVPPLLRW